MELSFAAAGCAWLTAGRLEQSYAPGWIHAYYLTLVALPAGHMLQGKVPAGTSRLRAACLGPQHTWGYQSAPLVNFK